jgi:TatD DNase family protein
MLAAAGMGEVDVPRVRVVVGAHPHNAKQWGDEALAEFRRLAADRLTCAVGEMGLDYHYDHSPRDIQRQRFSDHLALAHEFGLPAVVHLREAHDDGIAILREQGVPSAGCILHCFNLAPQVMEVFLDEGCHVSFAGPVTFKKAAEVRDAAALVPAGRILTETDCPFMAPEPFRGRTNEPALVVFTAQRLAEARGESPAQFATHSFQAAVSLLDTERS